MIITVIDDESYEEYIDLITCIYNVTEQEIKNREEKYALRENFFINQKIINRIKKCSDELCWKEYEIIIFVGNIANDLLKYSSIQACTMIIEGTIKCFITWKKNMKLLERVIIHELCHANRLSYNKIMKQADYYQYIDNELNWLYEEMLAISVEKKYFPDLEWTEIVGFNEHKHFYYYEERMEDKNICSIKDIYEIISAHKDDIKCYIYFLAYYISKKLELDKKLPEIFFMKTNKALEYLLCE